MGRPVGDRPRVAFFTPLGPVRSGISAYSEELLPHLSRRAAIDVVIASHYRPARQQALVGMDVIDVVEFRRRTYDATIYQVGNSLHHHGYMVPCMEAHPGILVLHDYCLHYLMLGLTLGRGDLASLRRMMRPVLGDRTDDVVRRLLVSRQDPFALSFAGPLIDRSRVVLVHSAYARDRVLEDHPAADVRVVPMGIQPQAAAEARVADVRRRYGLSSEEIVIASVSTLSHTKRVDLALRAVAEVRRAAPVRFLVVGGGPAAGAVAAAARRLDLADAIVQTGWVSDAEYGDLIAAADIVVDLRYPSGGETSASLGRALACGKPAVVTASGSFLELPDAAVVKIPVGPGEDSGVAAALGRLVTDRPTRLRMGEAARTFAAGHHSLERAAAGYAAAIAAVSGAPAQAARGAWFAPPPARSAAFFCSSAYRLGRVGHLYRQYGLVDTVRRIREELRNAAG
jgi:glycosyltransferase involved in cell wall biosynthesis